MLTLGIEDLSQIEVEEAYATLGSMNPRETPASIIEITAQDIRNSGARSLDELLDIYVPGFQYMYKVQGNQAGIRGIISDRNNKLLLMVNGRSMNVKASDGGAITERWFSMLGDIRRITVVNGPGSAVYGPGAIAGIINIETWSGRDYQGTDISARGGGWENFSSFEFRYGTELASNTGMFVYYGFDYYPGASPEEAPLKFSFDFQKPAYGVYYEQDSDSNLDVPNDNSTLSGRARHKFHLQLDGENYELWTRYTLSGQRIPADQYFYLNVPCDLLLDNGAGNQQFTLYGKYTQFMTSHLSLDYVLSYMWSDVMVNYGVRDTHPQLYPAMDDRHWSEDETIAGITAHIRPFEGHKVAIGTEYYYNNFGRRGHLYGDSPSNIQSLPIGTKWNSHMVSFFGEYQMRLTHYLLAIAGIRCDKHRYTSWMYSPRAALVYTPDGNNVVKFIYNHSVRHGDDADLYLEHKSLDDEGDIETLDNFELIYETQPTAIFHFNISAFYNRHHVVSFDRTTFRSIHVGLAQTYGIEVGLEIKRSGLVARLYHSYTKLIDFDLEDEDAVQNISAAPYGYGNDLANWMKHATKLIVDYDVTDELSLHGSARIYWGFSGSKDMAKYNRDKLRSLGLPVYASDGNAYDGSVLVTVGAEYQLSPQMDIMIHGYNLLGLFDEDLNKRNFFQRTSTYRDAAPAVAFRISCAF